MSKVEDATNEVKVYLTEDQWQHLKGIEDARTKIQADHNEALINELRKNTEIAHMSISDQMGIRDHFAGQALIGIGTWMPGGLSLDLTRPNSLRARAEWAYAQADAMIAARKGGEA